MPDGRGDLLGGPAGGDPLYSVPVALSGVVLLGALLLVAFSMAVHGVESLIDHKRSMASLTVLASTRMTWPWLVRSAAPDNLRAS